MLSDTNLDYWFKNPGVVIQTMPLLFYGLMGVSLYLDVFTWFVVILFYRRITKRKEGERIEFLPSP